MIVARTNTARRVLQRCVELAAPFRFSLSGGAAWRDEDCIAGAEDPEAAAASLLEEFEPAELAAAGIIETHHDGAGRLAFEITQEAGPLVVLRRTSGGLPTGLVTRRLAPVDGALPLEVMLQDRKTRRLLRSRDGMLFLCPTVEQVAVLRTLGMPAAPLFGILRRPMAGLRRLSAAVAKALPAKRGRAQKQPPRVRANIPAILSGDFETIDLETARKDARPRLYDELTLVLADWSPGPWNEQHAADVRATAAFLASAERLLGVELGTTIVWSPTAQERADLELLLRFRVKKPRVWSFVRDSVVSSNYAPSAFSAEGVRPREPASNYAEASEALQQQSGGGHVSGEPGTAWLEAVDRYRHYAARDLVAPLAQRATEANDSVERVLHSLAAETAGLFHAQAPEVLRRLAQWGRGVGAEDGGISLGQALQQQCATSKHLLQLIKELRK